MCVTLIPPRQAARSQRRGTGQQNTAGCVLPFPSATATCSIPARRGNVYTQHIDLSTFGCISPVPLSRTCQRGRPRLGSRQGRGFSSQAAPCAVVLALFHHSHAAQAPTRRSMETPTPTNFASSAGESGRPDQSERRDANIWTHVVFVERVLQPLMCEQLRGKRDKDHLSWIANFRSQRRHLLSTTAALG